MSIDERVSRAKRRKTSSEEGRPGVDQVGAASVRVPGVTERVCAKSPQLCLTFAPLWTYSPPGSSVHGFSRQEYWSGLPCLPLGDLPDPEIEPASLTSPALAGGFFITGKRRQRPKANIEICRVVWTSTEGGPAATQC